MPALLVPIQLGVLVRIIRVVLVDNEEDGDGYMNEKDLQREILYSQWSKGENIPWEAWAIIDYQNLITRRIGRVLRIVGLLLAIATSHFYNYYAGAGVIALAFIFSSIYSSNAAKKIENETGLSALDQWQLLKIKPQKTK